MYVIRQARHYYGTSATRRSLVLSLDTGTPAQFTTTEQTREHIKRLYATRYDLSHNEAYRPTYTILSMDRLPRYLREELAS